MKQKSLLSYFLIPIIMVVMFLTIMLSITLFTPKNYVIKIYGYDANINVATYRSPVGGKVLNTYIGNKTIAGYKFEGYYFNYNYTTKEFSNPVGNDYKIKENITIYAKWVKVEESA